MMPYKDPRSAAAKAAHARPAERHVLTAEECRRGGGGGRNHTFTAEERRRGGGSLEAAIGASRRAVAYWNQKENEWHSRQNSASA